MPKPVLPTIMLCLCLLVGGIPQEGFSHDTIVWMEAVLPPFFILSGPYKEQGYGDVITHLLQEGMPEYNHEEINTNISRHFYMFKQGENVCSVGLYNTPERQEFMYFSLPSFITLPPVVIIDKDNWHKFGNKPIISLDQVLGDEGMMVGLAKDRSYGNTLDDVLKKHEGQPNLVTFAGQELSRNLFKMLLLGRLDGLIGLPEEALYMAEQMGIRDQFITLTLQENIQNFDGWMSCVACSKTPWGKKVIERVNAILLQQRQTMRYQSAYERWLDPNSIVEYRQAYSKVFLESKK
nr:TIGR02285 family protein [uncultured Desulfobulbus sp.]